jgi:hypothetical protein
VTVTSASEGDKLDESSSVDLEKFGEIVKIKFHSSGKYAGLIKLPVIRKLLDDTAVQSSATMIEARPSSTERLTRKGSTLWHSSTVRIVLAGPQQEKSRIGNLLSDAHQFLQHPYAEECGEFEYCNPHYLVRPGASMPKLQDADGISSASAKPLSSLTELNKSRVMRIFDGAGLEWQMANRFQNLISHRVKSDLKQ